MYTDKRTDSSIKEAFMLRVLEELHSAPLAHPCVDHKNTVWLQRCGWQSFWMVRIYSISSCKLFGLNVQREDWWKSIWLNMAIWQEAASDGIMGALSMWWSRVWKWERIREAVDLMLFRKRMWVRSVILSGPRLETVTAFVWLWARTRSCAWEYICMFALVCACLAGSDCVGALEVVCLCTYFNSSWALYVRLPAHCYAGLVIKTIIPSHKLTHMFVEVWLFIFSFSFKRSGRDTVVLHH